MTERLTDRELAELAKMLPPGRPTTMDVLVRAGFDETLLPAPSSVTNSFEYWRMINTEVAAGTVENGRRRIIEAALHRYPHNPVLVASRGPSRWRVLFIGTSPTGVGALRADRELRQVRAAGAVVDVHDYPAATVADLNRIRTERPDILHLACHGRGPLLVFDDGQGAARTVHTAEIAATLGVYRQEIGVRLRGIVLNACRSEEAAELLRPYADVVIAHREELDDADGVAFGGALYQALPDAGGLAAAARIAASELVRDNPARRRLASGLVVLEGGA